MNRNQTQGGPFRIHFVYTDEILSDFEALYWAKGKLSLPARILCLVIGVIGAIYFGLELYHQGFAIVRVGYLILCSLMILVGCSSRKRSGTDDTLKKYRKYYQDRGVSFLIDESGIEMKLEKQQNYAKSKFRQIYGLFETDKCFYFVIKGKAYYIVSKQALPEGDADALRTYMERHCKKKFQAYQV